MQYAFAARPDTAIAAFSGVAPDIDRIAATLKQDGFVAIDTLFTPAQVGDVAAIMDRTIDRMMKASVHPQGRGLVVKYPRQDRCAQTGGLDDPWDQVELNHSASIAPELLKTELFRGCARLASKLLPGSSRAFDHAIYKAGGNITDTPWHQDAAFQLLPRFAVQGLHFWIPLQDATLENGCIEFVAGSHDRGVLPHSAYLRPSGEYGQRIQTRHLPPSTPCPLAVGGLTIHSPRTLHYAGQNYSDAPRKAWIIQFNRFGAVTLGIKRLAGKVPFPGRSPA